MRGHEIQDFLSQEDTKPELTMSLARAALDLAKKGVVDVNDALEME
jgi:hypothetical protein